LIFKSTPVFLLHEIPLKHSLIKKLPKTSKRSIQKWVEKLHLDELKNVKYAVINFRRVIDQVITDCVLCKSSLNILTDQRNNYEIGQKRKG